MKRGVEGGPGGFLQGGSVKNRQRSVYAATQIKVRYCCVAIKKKGRRNGNNYIYSERASSFSWGSIRKRVERGSTDSGSSEGENSFGG